MTLKTILIIIAGIVVLFFVIKGAIKTILKIIIIIAILALAAFVWHKIKG